MARWFLKPLIRRPTTNFGGGLGALGYGGGGGGGGRPGSLFGGGYWADVYTGLLGGAAARLGLVNSMANIFASAFAGPGYGYGYGGGGVTYTRSGGPIAFGITIETDLAKFFGDLRAEILRAFRRAVRAASIDMAASLEYSLIARCPRDTGKLVHSIRCRAEGVKGAAANARGVLGGGGGRASTRVLLTNKNRTLASIRVTMESYGFILNGLAFGRHRGWIDRAVAQEVTVGKFAEAVRKHYRMRTADLGLPGR